jgi:hypothetical protein
MSDCTELARNRDALGTLVAGAVGDFGGLLRGLLCELLMIWR